MFKISVVREEQKCEILKVDGGRGIDPWSCGFTENSSL